MSSRQSNSRRRANTETAVDCTPRNNMSRPLKSESTEVFCRPPLTSMTTCTNQGTSQLPSPPTTKRLSLLPPHPYQPYTPASHHYHNSATAIPAVSTTHLQPGPDMNALSPVSSVNVDPADPKFMTVQHTYYVHHHYYNNNLQPVPPQNLSPNPPQNPPPPSQRRAQVVGTLYQLITGSRVRKYRRFILFLLFVPLPPLLSVLYVVIGHSLLRRASSSSPTNTDNNNPWSPSFLSSANAAATGGAILSLPLFLTLYIIIPALCCAPTGSRTPGDDFFEDDDEEMDGRTLTHILDILRYLACAIILICVGGAAAALGVACLDAKKQERQADRMLTAGRAAEAGIVGGAVLLAALLMGAVMSVVAWLWMIRKRRSGAEEEKR
ncbi:hypothetical protein C0993_000794 [Termitomyces sp. T159_Od127]|nr:hypothetical protein C0993_000794 [Termitomyces sp. T159_Od127]